MATVITFTALLLCCSIADSKVLWHDCTINATVGGSAIVPLMMKFESTQNLRWFHNQEKIYDSKLDSIIQGTGKKIYPNGSLQLTNLQKSQEGVYVPGIYSHDGEIIPNMKSSRLCISEKVAKPQLKIECKPSHVKFICSVEQVKTNSFQWFKNGQVLPQETESILRRNTAEVLSDSFKCGVFNITSNQVKQNCQRPKLFGLPFWIMVAILASGGGFVLILFIAVIFCCIRAKRKKRARICEEEELRLRWSHSQQHNPQPKGLGSGNQIKEQHHQRQPPGHTCPRQPAPRQQRNQRPGGQSEPGTRRPPQISHRVPDDEDAPPALPKPRKSREQ